MNLPKVCFQWKIAKKISNKIRINLNLFYLFLFITYFKDEKTSLKLI